jgi:hypothetical protein
MERKLDRSMDKLVSLVRDIQQAIGGMNSTDEAWYLDLLQGFAQQFLGSFRELNKEVLLPLLFPFLLLFSVLLTSALLIRRHGHSCHKLEGYSYRQTATLPSRSFATFCFPS